MLNARTLIAGAALLVVIVAIAVFRDESRAPTVPTTKSDPEHRAPSLPRDSAPAHDESPQAQSGSGTTDEGPAASSGNDAVFRTDVAGELVLDEDTRLNIETLIALTEPRELYAAVREQTEELSPAAARQAAELVDKFVHYQQAQRQTYPPDDAPLTAEEAITQLEGLHALREAHFGSEVARRFFGKEEAIGREMIEVMRVENDQSLTGQEKLERAEALRERLPGVAAIERSNRESAKTQKQPE